MDGTAARVLMGDSLGFHILIALFGVGLPLLLLIFEWLALRHHDKRLLAHVETWSKVATTLVVAGVISGTIISFQMSLMWPTFMKLAGPVVGQSFMIEGYAFLLEAIFLGFYVATWRKLKGYKHWLLTWPMMLGATGSAVFITTINGWMSQPQGYAWQNGQIVSTNYLSAAFSTTSNLKIIHSVLSYYAATALAVGAVYVWLYLRRRTAIRQRQFYKSIATKLYVVAAVCLIGVVVAGDISARYLATQSPRKLAAFELHEYTSDHAPLYVGGSLNTSNGQVSGAIKLPDALSVLVGDSPNTVVTGLDKYQTNNWPPLTTHILFDLMVILGVLSLVIPLASIAVAWLHKRFKLKIWRWLERPVWLVSLLAAPLTIVVIEVGWAMAEIARQPWTIENVLLTKDAFTKNDGVLQFGYIFPILFVILLILTAIATVIATKRFAPKETT